MADDIVWTVVGLILVIAELVTGTFYLLVLGAGALVAAGVAYLGFGFGIQAVVAAVISIAGVYVIRQRRHTMSTQGDAISGPRPAGHLG